ncbi:hypothetical protein [Streptomyces sp. 8N706]|uniref:hypothetical protein n=1 Tax=Streptomyces sp. 8N706 TaxID=3457416 RepID=UPI003FD0F149
MRAGTADGSETSAFVADAAVCAAPPHVRIPARADRCLAPPQGRRLSGKPSVAINGA